MRIRHEKFTASHARGRKRVQALLAAGKQPFTEGSKRQIVYDMLERGASWSELGAALNSERANILGTIREVVFRVGRDAETAGDVWFFCK